MDEQLVQRILRGYGMELARLLPAQSGYRNLSQPVVLKSGQTVNALMYKCEPGIVRVIKNANVVSDFVAQNGLPSRQTLSRKIFSLKNHTTDMPPRYGALYTFLPGSTIPWEAYTMDHIKLLGMAMGRMHMVLRAFPLDMARLPQAAETYRHILGRMSRYFGDSSVRIAANKKLLLTLSTPGRLDDLQNLLDVAAALPDQHVLHLDFVRGNILFAPVTEQLTPGNALPAPDSGGSLRYGAYAITGILDFEKVAVGHPVLDVARSLSFLMVDCKYKTPAQVRKYFLHSGYFKRGLSPIFTHPDRIFTDLLEPLIGLFLLYDYYKFLRHNPYDNLPGNEHYVRTRDILVARGILAPLT